jgi:hypothetical protein
MSRPTGSGFAPPLSRPLLRRPASLPSDPRHHPHPPLAPHPEQGNNINRILVERTLVFTGQAIKGVRDKGLECGCNERGKDTWERA